MPTSLEEIAPAFIEMAHTIVWATVATVDKGGRPNTRVLHPIWEFDGDKLTGWILTSPNSPKAKDLALNPAISLTYWNPAQDNCTANCEASWDETPAERQAGWDRFANGPAPVGYLPSIIPPWTSPDAEEFGVLRLQPRSLRVMPGTMMTAGHGSVLSWKK